MKYCQITVITVVMYSEDLCEGQTVIQETYKKTVTLQE
jgi:hypothetical protein